MKRIKISLSEQGLKQAQDEIENYIKSLTSKEEQFITRLADYGIKTIKSNSGKYDVGTFFVVNSMGNGIVNGTIRIDGEDLLFVEFGAGVHYNGHPHSSPHPKGEELDMRIGEYGKGHGLEDGWFYYEEGVRKYTQGIKAKMPVYKASLKMRDKMEKVAKEVFGS